MIKDRKFVNMNFFLLILAFYFINQTAFNKDGFFKKNNPFICFFSG